MNNQTVIHPLNIKGKYYVDYETCLDHGCCVYEAPSNFKIDRETWGAYIYKQPETPEELKQVEEAMNCCPVEAILDDGEMQD